MENTKEHNKNQTLIEFKEREKYMSERALKVERPEDCPHCIDGTLYFWDETDKEIIFRCSFCRKYLTIPFNKNNLKFYFSF